MKNNQNKQFKLSRPYYGIYAGDKQYSCLPVPNPDSYKSNQKLYSKVPVNTHLFGKIVIYPITEIDGKKYNKKINYGHVNASAGPYFGVNTNVAPSSYTTTTKYGKKSAKW